MSAIGQTFPPGQNVGNTTSPPTPLPRFLLIQPKALGTVQIMIGLVTFLFGIVLVSEPGYAPVSVLTGNVYWASIVYIIAGSLSVAAENRLHPCVVQGSLGMNVVSAIFSAVGVGVLLTDFFLYYYCYSGYECYMFEARSKAISGVLLVFAILQFIISICLSVYASKATCCADPMLPVVGYANQAAPDMPQNGVFIPQAQVNMYNRAPQHAYQWPHST